MTDNELIKKNREYLDNYFLESKEKNSLTFKQKLGNVYETFGLIDTIKFCLKKVISKKNSYISNKFEEKELYKKNNLKIVVYTAIVGKYDKLLEPIFVDENVDYYIFTEEDIPKSSKWIKKEFPKDEYFQNLNNYQKAKYFKIFPEKFFPDYDYSIWIDGNIELHGSLAPFVNRMKNKYWAEFKHPTNKCIYDEVYTIVSQGKAKGEILRKQINFYKKQKFPRQYGLFENSFIIRKHNELICKRIENDWWEEMLKFSWRDQLSLTYVLWKNNVEFSDICCLGECWRWNPRLRQYNHK